MKVKAAVAHERGKPLRIQPLELSEPRADEVLVRLVASSFSRADLDAIDGTWAMPLPFVPGSEGAGIVERVGADVTHLAAGESVVTTFAWCGHCENCLAGRPKACVEFAVLNLSGRRLDGSTPFVAGDWDVNGSFFGQSSFATHSICRATNAVAVPADAPLEILAALGGELMLGAGTVLHTFRAEPSDSLLVFGAGAVGLVAAMVAKARGVSIIVVADPDEARRAAASRLGATVAVHPAEGLADLIHSISAQGMRFAIETTGDAGARQACLDCLTSGGICALVRSTTDQRVDFDDQLAEGAPLLVSVDGGAPPSILIPELIRLRDAGLFPFEELIALFPFERVNDALGALRSGEITKAVLRFRLGAFDDLDRSRTAGAVHEAPAETSGDEADSSNVLVKP